MQAIDATFAAIGELIGYDVDHISLTANETLSVTFYWCGVSWVDKDYRVFAQLLTDDDRLIAQSDSVSANGSRPTRSWINDEIIIDRHVLHVVDATYQGDAILIIGMYDPETLERVPNQNGENFVLLPTRIRVNAP
jgi:hypothetical protein